MSAGDATHLYGRDAPTTADGREAFASGSVPVAVYGLGKMGLPLACVFAESCGAVTGVDVEQRVVDAVNDGRSHVTGEPGLEELLAREVERGRLRATTDGERAAREASVHVIIVPTLVGEGETPEPDLSLVETVVETIGSGLSPGDLVIVESTLPPGTCADVVEPHLAAASGLESGSFGVAFCPERTASGTALRDIRGAYPKVVGGVDDASARAAAQVYREVSSNDVHIVRDATTAEAVKVFEGIYRDVNIALANELARIADDLGISVREAIETANHIPMSDIHEPGPGVGGHCIPYYPYFLLAQTDDPMDLVRTARRTNETMPEATVTALERELERTGTALEEASVAVLGLTYRPSVAETRASPAIGVVDALGERAESVYGVDPLVDPAAFGADPLARSELPETDLDAAVLVTAQPEFYEIDWAGLEPMVVLDGRDVLSRESVEAHGHTYRALAGSIDGWPRVLEGEGPPAETPTYVSDLQRERAGATGED
ncbi:nucleotide sugar dehydrogenase [Natronobiforma cellulositropha]|uniref:nucleotide sugar dehydrogenase n=1 Tax=Natronobiforma cellulositropha TaxID=1679076 RepID=UPI0021D5DD5E|nr:nucleotide sugar dehydrogenase [Natronobiforma cellulositropha]